VRNHTILSVMSSKSDQMKAPADKTAKRISTEEWFARYDSADLLKPQRHAPRPKMQPPADRVAVRA